MIINKAYIYLKDKKSEFLIEEIIRSSFENVEISVENDVLAVSTIDDSAFQLKLTKINKTKRKHCFCAFVWVFKQEHI